MLHVYKFCKSIFQGRPSHNIHRLVLGIRNKSRQESLPHTHQQSVHGRVEMDSHANTTVLGSNCVVLAYTGKECEVSPYADEYNAIRNVPVVTGATVWTNSQDGVPILLVFNKALWMGDRLHHTLINPNQLRSYGVDVQDNPFAKEDLAIITDDYIIPLDTQGTTIFCDTRSLQRSNCSSYQGSYLHLRSIGTHRKYNSLPITQTGLFRTPLYNTPATFVFIRQPMTRSIFPQGLSNKFRLIGQKGKRTQPYDKTYLPPGLSSPENVIRG